MPPQLGPRPALRLAASCLLLAGPPACAQAVLVLNGGPTTAIVVGTGTDGKTISDAARTTQLGHPRGLSYDVAGNLYLADSRNNQVDRVAPDGAFQVVAGTGEQGFSGDGGAASQASLNAPASVALRQDGTLLIADTGNHRIRSVSPAGVITTIAGSAAGFAGDGRLATSAHLRSPAGLAVNVSGDIYLADTGNHRIRRIAPNGILTTVVGTGEEGDTGDGASALSATLRTPTALLALPDGRLLIADTAAHRIRVLQTDGVINPFHITASLRRPTGLSAGTGSDVLISDADLQQVLLSSGTSIAGNGTQGTAIAGPAKSSPFDSPSGVAMAGNGDLAISDRRNHTVQQIQLPQLDFGSVPAGQVSSPQLLTLKNGGSTALQLTTITLPASFADSGAGTCPPLPTRLDATAQCTVSIVFRPTAQGTSAGIGSVSAAGDVTASIRLTGNASAPASLAPSITALSSGGSISYSGAPVQLKATVAGSLLSPPSGTVSFMDGATLITTAPLNGSTTTYSTSALRIGSHTLHAVYSGDAKYATSISTDLTVTVVAAPDFTFTASAASYSGKTSTIISVPMTLLPINGTLNRPLTLAVTGLPSSFKATITPAQMTIAADPINSVMTITVPATIAQSRWKPGAFLAFVIVPMLWRRKRTLACSVSLLILSGCGGGFRTVSTATGTGPVHYTLTVSATTIGVLGDPLVHTVPVELVITP